MIIVLYAIGYIPVGSTLIFFLKNGCGTGAITMIINWGLVLGGGLALCAVYGQYYSRMYMVPVFCVSATCRMATTIT